ncbi:hypothetical protein Tco_0359399 [Tanacetum coccineum]
MDLEEASLNVNTFSLLLFNFPILLCDLVICVADCKEKLASGLLEPFVAHLKYAKDQVSKGGYSIKLSAPDSAFWFTKSTLERSSRYSGWLVFNVLEIRKAVLQREQAMVYARALVAGFETDNLADIVGYVLQREQAMVYARALAVGFETDNLADLVCFADAFGSPRLRDACLNFMELCNTKSIDTVWKDEVAAIQAYSCSQYDYMERSGGILEYDNGKEFKINNRVGNLRSTDEVSPVIKRPNTFKEKLISHKFKEPDTIPSVTRPKFKERDIFEDNFKSVERTKDVLVDDPLAVQA